jgi:outer membrane receptor protein involved in Fe transport
MHPKSPLPLSEALRLLLAGTALLFSGLSFPAAAAGAETKPFDIPAESAETALKEFAAQAGVEVLYSTENTAGVRTNAVKGEFAPAEAVRQMLDGTPLYVVDDTKNGILRIARNGDPNGPRAEQTKPGARPNRNTPESGEGGTARDANEVLTLSPFRVEGAKDEGYSSQRTIIGSRSAKELIDLPTSIAIINRQLIDDLGSAKLTESLQYGVSGVQRNQTLSDDLTIRGFRNNSGPLRDGASRSGIFRSTLYDVERIEVLKGPGALMLGIDSFLGGTVNLISRKPTAQHTGVIDATVGDQSYVRVVANDSGPLYKSPDFTALYRVTLGTTQSDGARGIDGVNDRFIGGALTFYYGNRTEISLNAYQMIDRTYLYWFDFPSFAAANTPTVINPLSGPRVNPALAQNVHAHFNERLVNFTLTTKLTDNADFRLFGSYEENVNDSVYVFWSSLAADNYTLGRRTSRSYFDVSRAVIQADFLYRTEREPFKNEFSTGGDYQNPKQVAGSVGAVIPGTIDARNPDLSHDDTIVPKLSGAAFTSYADVVGRNASYYVQDNLSLLRDRKLILVGGRRWLNPKEYTDNLLTKTSAQSLTKPTTSDKYGLVAKPLPYVALYATRARITTPLFGFDTLSNGTLVPLKDQQGVLREFGLKANFQPFQGVSLYGTFAKYNMEVTNARTFVVINGVLEPSQSEKQTAKGYELDLGLRADMSAMTLDVIAAYQHEDTYDPGTKLPVPGAPPWTWSVLAKVTVKAGPLKGFRLGVGTRDEAQKLQRSYFINVPQLYSVFAGYEWSRHWNFQVNVDNASDERYLVSTSGALAQGGEPRTVRFTTSFHY